MISARALAAPTARRPDGVCQEVAASSSAGAGSTA